MKYFNKTLKKGSKVLDACAGTGIYSFYLAKKGCQVTAGDMVDYNVSIIKEKQLETPLLNEVYTGSVLDLSRFEDDSFDAVLCMGALYHIKDEYTRKKAIKECLRVLKSEGIFVASYINKYAVILHNCEDELSNMAELLQYYKESYQGIFYGSSPKEIIDVMENEGLKTLHNIATDGSSYLVNSKLNNSSSENFNKWLQLHFESCEEV